MGSTDRWETVMSMVVSLPVNTAILIYLVAAALATAGAVTHAAVGSRRPRPAPVDLTEIQAQITVYDFVDGREVNRRPAYPFAGVALAMRGLTPAAARLTETLTEFGDAMKRWSDGAVKGPW